jgi:hypothetical protein
MNPSAITIQVHLCYKIFGTETWSNKKRSALFWRLYWNANQGARLILNRNVVELTPDKVVLIPPNTPFDKQASNDVHHFFIHFSLSYASGQIEPGLYELPITPEINVEIQETISLFNAGLTETPRFSLLTNLIVAQTLIGLADKIQTPAVTDPRLVMVFSFMDKHVGDRITNTFIHFFRMKMKTTPKKFFEAKRFQKACNLLRYSNLSIDHIAEQTGFCDRNHFTKAFVRREKVGPAEFRKKTEIGA